MKTCAVTGLASMAFFFSGGSFSQTPVDIGSEEFGLTPRELRDHVERVEQLIAQCMREQGFQYIAVDYGTVREGMNADKILPGMSEDEFIQEYGLGISTLYTGEPPQLAIGYSPGKVGLGEQNIAIYANLPQAEKVAYNRALLGGDFGETFAVALEAENFSRTGGCTRAAVEQVFERGQLESSFYNPLDALIREDPRMKDALEEYADEMRDAGFPYTDPDEVEPDIRERLAALTNGGALRVEEMTPVQKAALEELQDFERRAALKDLELAEEVFEPVETEIEQELFARQLE